MYDYDLQSVERAVAQHIFTPFHGLSRASVRVRVGVKIRVGSELGLGLGLGFGFGFGSELGG